MISFPYELQPIPKEEQGIWYAVNSYDNSLLQGITPMPNSITPFYEDMFSFAEKENLMNTKDHFCVAWNRMGIPLSGIQSFRDKGKNGLVF